MITHVAIKDINGKIWSLPRPNRHHNIFIFYKDAMLKSGIQGFLRDDEHFLTREEAFIHVMECKQAFDQKRNVSTKILFSEGVW